MKVNAIIATISIVFAFGCAQVVPLTGGDKDETPPSELKSTPENKSINFAAQTITIEFDEFIKLQNLQQQLIVSPVMEKKPEVSIKGKKLIIKLKEELTPNTTYSINFGNAIVDITENNPIPNFKYVFSTGSYLDSLSFSGSVVDAFELKTVDKIYVMLYDELEDSVPMKQLPRYVAITDKTGGFSVTNMAHGNYKVFALQDINANYLYDLPNEKIAFMDNPIKIDSSLTHQHLFLFEEKQDNQFLKKIEHKEFGKVIFYLNQPSQNITISTNRKEKIRWYEEERNPTNDTIIHWLLGVGDFKEAEYYISEGKKMLDTTTVSFIPSTKFKDTSFDLNKQLFISTPRPISVFNSSTIIVLEDSIPIHVLIEESKTHPRKYELNYKFKEKTNYEMLIPSGVFQDILGLKNDTLRSSFTTKSDVDYGKIILKLTTSFNKSYILQLFKNNTLINESYFLGNQIINYDFLQAGDYKFRLIVDDNNNQKWDTGDYLNKKQPEEMIHYQKPITIRANWDNEIIWNIKL
jgi:uncharacterized protein (DUF2141 family)